MIMLRRGSNVVYWTLVQWPVSDRFLSRTWRFALAKYLRETGEQLEEVRARLGSEE